MFASTRVFISDHSQKLVIKMISAEINRPAIAKILVHIY